MTTRQTRPTTITGRCSWPEQTLSPPFGCVTMYAWGAQVQSSKQLTPPPQVTQVILLSAAISRHNAVLYLVSGPEICPFLWSLLIVHSTDSRSIVATALPPAIAWLCQSRTTKTKPCHCWGQSGPECPCPYQPELKSGLSPEAAIPVLISLIAR